MRGRLTALLLAACAFVVAGAARAADCDWVVDVRGVQRSAGSAVAEVVQLPDTLPLALRGERARVRYEIDVSPCADRDSAALWIFRAGAPYRIVDDSGEPLALLSARRAFGAWPTSGADIYNGRIPALFALAPGTKRVALELQTLTYLPSGLVAARVGPANLLLPVQAAAMDDVVAHADAASGVVLVLGAFALLLWLPRRQDRSLLWLAVACGLWGVRGVVYFGHAVYLAPVVFEQFNPLNVLLAAAALTASVLALVGGLDRRWARGLAIATALPVAGLALASAVGQGALAARGVSLAAGAAMVSATLWQVIAHRRALATWRATVLALGVAGLLGCAVHDMMVVAGRLPPTEPSYVFWGFVALLVGFAAIGGQYVVTTLNRAERSNEELERHVVLKTQELERSYAQLRENERETARTQERERLLRDMHDGLGAQLVTALRGVERGALSQEQVTQSLQDGLDELRLLMDSADMGHYLPGALAAWRNRWDARIAAAGTQLHWNIDESVDEAQVPGDVALQLLRILQEAATNVVKHASARHLRFDARVAADGERRVLRITISDDGAGLPAEGPRNGARGLANMRQRARLIGADFRIGVPASGQGTELALAVPV